MRIHRFNWSNRSMIVTKFLPRATSNKEFLCHIQRTGFLSHYYPEFEYLQMRLDYLHESLFILSLF